MVESEKKRRTVGDLSRELLLKDTNETHSPLEQTREQLKDYEENIGLCIKDGKKNFMSDFYVVVLTKKEKLMQNVLRNYFFYRLSCPTPDYDQVVYKYNIAEDKLDVLWVIPDKKTCVYFKEYTTEVDPSQWELLLYVLKFADGSLFKQAKSLNNEKNNTIELKDNNGRKNHSNAATS